MLLLRREVKSIAQAVEVVGTDSHTKRLHVYLSIRLLFLISRPRIRILNQLQPGSMLVTTKMCMHVTFKNKKARNNLEMSVKPSAGYYLRQRIENCLNTLSTPWTRLLDILLNLFLASSL
jgi:hypothetical protein